MKQYRTSPGFVLSRQNLGEYDRIIRLFTRDFGRVDAVAKGVRKPTSKLASRMEPFHEVQWRLVDGRGLPTIIGADIIQAAPDIRELKTLWQGHGILELTEHSFSAEEEAVAWYELLREAIPTALSDRGDVAWFVALSRSLDELGLTPELPNTETVHTFHLANGHFDQKAGTHEISPRMLKLWRLSQHTTLRQILKLQDITADVRALNDLLEQFWHYHTGFTLRSRQLI
ncbi:DNA repair protein RecO [bacterium]|nr:DNA repair protein RecO [bacterium]